MKSLINRRKHVNGEVVFDIFNYLFMIFLVFITLYPFLNVLAISLNNSVDTVKGGITVFPRQFTLANYKSIFENNAIAISVFVSVARTVVGTVLGIISTAMVAYVISRKDFIARKFVTVVFVVTMYVSGGLIPEYMLIRNLQLAENFWVYILPGLISVFNVIVLRSFIEGLPFELQEAAKIDGANDLMIFVRIILPLCIPVIATLSLFIAVGQWNSWFDTYLYCSSSKNLTTLQFELQKILMSAQSSGQDIYGTSDTLMRNKVSPESLRMAMTVIATLPILCVYPFVQRYFIKGLTLGSVKS